MNTCSHCCCLKSSSLLILNNNNSDSDDLDSAEAYEEGVLLAQELYARVRIMEDKKKQDLKEREEYLRQLNSEPFRRRKQMSSSGPKSNVKNTNNDRTNNPFLNINRRGGGDDMLDDGSSSSVEPSTYRRRSRSSIGRARTVKNNNGNGSNFLLDSASSERNILIQIAVVSILLIAAIGIGLNGGITDGSERVLEDISAVPGDGMDGFLDQFVGGSNDEAVTQTSSEGTIFI